MKYCTANFDDLLLMDTGDQLNLFDNMAEMNAEHLKYQRRKHRTIGNQRFELSEPTNMVSGTMQKIPSYKTSIESILEAHLIYENISYSHPDQIIEKLEGKPDFVIPRHRIAIFCDGDFWHGYTLEDSGIENNREFWKAKIESNIKRDVEVNSILGENSWDVIRFWEHEIKNDPHACIRRLKDLINKKNQRALPQNFTFYDLFSGIGGFRIPLEELGGRCIGFSEIDKNSIETYKTNFLGYGSEDELELGDVSKVNLKQLPQADLVVGGVPCQAWSIAGKQGAFDDPRGRLWLSAIQFVKVTQPKAFIFENVKGLIDPRNKKNLEAIIAGLKMAGYTVKKPEMLNSYDFGLPQNRDRVFIVGFRDDLKDAMENFSYPLPLGKKVQVSDLTSITSNSRYPKKQFLPADIFGDKIPVGRNRFQTQTELNDFFVFSDVRNGHTTIHSWEIIKTSKREKNICLAILKNRRKKIYGEADGNPIPFSALKLLVDDLKETELLSLVEKKILRKVAGRGYEFVNSKISAGINGIYRVYLPESKIFSTLTATGSKDHIALKSISGDDPQSYKENFIKEIIKKKEFRQITAKEAGLLQGFPTWFAIHSKPAIANKQFGNAVSTAVIFNLAKQILLTQVLD